MNSLFVLRKMTLKGKKRQVLAFKVIHLFAPTPQGAGGRFGGGANRLARALGERALKRAGSSDLAVMQGSGHYQNKMADIIVDRQRADVRHYPVVFIRCKKEQNTFSLRSFSVLFKFPSEHPREQISVLNIFSTSVTCNFLDSIRKWHHNPDDSTEIMFRLILSVLHFSLILSCVIHHPL